MPRRAWLVAALAACSASAGARPKAPTHVAARPDAKPQRSGVPIDPMPFLLDEPPSGARSAVTPRAAFVELGGVQVAPDGEAKDAIEVLLVELGTTLARVAVRTPAVRYVIWVRRADLHGVLAKDVTVGASMPGKPSATIRRGARVEILERTAETVRFRYSGGVEIEARAAPESVTEQGELVDGGSPIFSGGRIFHAVPGLAIRAEPRWSAPVLAVLARTYLVEEVRPIDEAWSEVQYIDGAVSVRGFASRRDPPVALHARSRVEPTTPLATTDKLPGGVCLYASPQGEIVGVTVAATPVVLDGDEREDWRGVTFDTPWSAMRFFARRARGAWQPCERAP